MNPNWPDYHNCISNVMASIAEYFRMKIACESLPYLDDYLKHKPFRNLVLLLLDGMGVSTMEEMLSPQGFLRAHYQHKLSTVFPPTTTAAITTIQSGLNPVGHAWAGWTLYFQQTGQNVDIFTNKLQYSDKSAGKESLAKRYLPYESFNDRLSRTTGIKALQVSPFGDIVVDSFSALLEKTLELTKEPGKHFLYSYWGEPDSLMHQTGCHGKNIKALLQLMEHQIESFAKALPEDSLLIVTADHGLVDAEALAVNHHPKLSEMLLRPMALEARAAAFFVKPEYVKAFPEAFKEAFGTDNFLLIPSAEAIKSGLFGPGEPHPQLGSILGDYLAIALKEYALYDRIDHCHLIGMHAGMSSNEMQTPLILYHN